MLNLIASCFLLAGHFFSKRNSFVLLLPIILMLPCLQITPADQVVGVYLNILYPQDKEQIQQKEVSRLD